MTEVRPIPKGAAIAVGDLLDHCAKIQPGQEVVLLAHIDGLYGGDNLVDEKAISWIQAAIQQRGANASVLWIDEQAKPHACDYLLSSRQLSQPLMFLSITLLILSLKNWLSLSSFF